MRSSSSNAVLISLYIMWQAFMTMEPKTDDSIWHARTLSVVHRLRNQNVMKQVVSLYVDVRLKYMYLLAIAYTIYTTYFKNASYSIDIIKWQPVVFGHSVIYLIICAIPLEDAVFHTL